MRGRQVAKRIRSAIATRYDVLRGYLALSDKAFTTDDARQLTFPSVIDHRFTIALVFSVMIRVAVLMTLPIARLLIRYLVLALLTALHNATACQRTAKHCQPMPVGWLP
jgi:hypothetical protein